MKKLKNKKEEIRQRMEACINTMLVLVLYVYLSWVFGIDLCLFGSNSWLRFRWWWFVCLGTLFEILFIFGYFRYLVLHMGWGFFLLCAFQICDFMVFVIFIGYFSLGISTSHFGFTSCLVSVWLFCVFRYRVWWFFLFLWEFQIWNLHLHPMYLWPESNLEDPLRSGWQLIFVDQ